MLVKLFFSLKIIVIEIYRTNKLQVNLRLRLARRCQVLRAGVWPGILPPSGWLKNIRIPGLTVYGRGVIGGEFQGSKICVN
ncbi:hypothetical protein EBL_c09200 [Shimwellia blattae DSM 4481 = NBRC 105725]|uniref:Uncharacterized protein n=1 Tax=Shimwellia blattae (strain ATCC 29907 / DSM 4481 / JCM 1650 / NBRC 105725 / CDC 9005-74) TaxID=630626 RepID=I2B681_SHIBC|nr:hypothetical protein EBL_c09200 [Shimwellia blattae DSM 4481 = NBRC 105725]